MRAIDIEATTQHNKTVQNADATSVRSRKRSLGLKAIGKALWSLATPDEFTSLKPSHEGELYREDNQSGIAPRADIYLPEVDHAPSVVLVHGGGFVIGSRKMKPVRFLASEFCRAGYAVCAIDYRMIFRGGGLEQALEDVLAALLWWEKQSQSYKLDTNRIHLCGISAGATLSCLAAAKPQTDFLQSLVCFFGLYDFSALRGPLAKLFERTLVENAEWTEYAPMQQELAPLPALLLHGDADTLVYCEQAQAFAELRQSQNLQTELKTYADQPHGFMNHVTPGSKKALQDVLGFLGCGD
jgi:acetyl esterase/lipase